MKRIIFPIFLFLNFNLVFADEPPSWQPYKKVSKNSEFFVSIDYANCDTIKYSWERKWQFSVFKKDSTLFWKREFRPTGYDDGTITDDGKNFVIIKFWYYPTESVVSVLNKNYDDFFIKGEEFKIPKIFVSQAASHKLWRENYDIKDNLIFIKTLDKTIWKIDIDNKTLEKESSINFYLWIVFSILIILILCVNLIKKRNNRKNNTL